MALRHLTDDEIQAHEQGRRSRDQAWIAAHLESCEFCKEQAVQYRNLFAALQKEVQFSLPANFAHSIISEIKLKSAFGFQGWLSHILLAILGLGVVGATALYFLGIGPLTKLLLTVRNISDSISLDWLARINTFVSGLNMNISLLGSAILVFFIMSVIDHYLLRSKRLTSLTR